MLQQIGEGSEISSQMALPDTLLDCKVCHDIWCAFTAGKVVHNIKLGSFEDAVSSKCPRHTPLVEHFRDYCIIHHGDISNLNDVGISGVTGITLTKSLSRGGLLWDLLLLKQDCIPNHVGTGRILDPDWVDLDIVKLWKSQCLESHGPKCENPMKIWPTRPAWLIDIENKCVVSGNCRGPYVALSYRYGRDSCFRVDSDTMAKLRKPNSLDIPETSMNLTPILKHAMYLASTIGERYLWADALCIVHGDDTATAEQLNLMSAIYASAIVTIIAADGDSQDGLLGLRDVSAPRNLEQRSLPFGQEKLVVQNTHKFSLRGGTPYYNRGWIFQEHKMSPRKIWFNRKEVHWECQCNVWHEEMILGAESNTYIDPRLGVILSGFPDLGSLSILISDYNNLEFRYEEDALPAISGLLSVVSRSFTGGFLYGLSEMLFDLQLGWKPSGSRTNLRRRVQSDRPSRCQLSHLRLPSWSWIGWQGMVTNGNGEAARINHRQGYIRETIPLTEWYTSSSRSGSPSRRIRSTWFEERDAFNDIAKPLPVGWTRHKILADDLNVDKPRLYPVDAMATFSPIMYTSPSLGCQRASGTQEAKSNRTSRRSYISFSFIGTHGLIRQ